MGWGGGPEILAPDRFQIGAYFQQNRQTQILALELILATVCTVSSFQIRRGLAPADINKNARRCAISEIINTTITMSDTLFIHIEGVALPVITALARLARLMGAWVEYPGPTRTLYGTEPIFRNEEWALT